MQQTKPPRKQKERTAMTKQGWEATEAAVPEWTRDPEPNWSPEPPLGHGKLPAEWVH